jgi:hypothetical protein
MIRKVHGLNQSIKPQMQGFGRYVRDVIAAVCDAVAHRATSRGSAPNTRPRSERLLLGHRINHIWPSDTSFRGWFRLQLYQLHLRLRGRNLARRNAIV